MARIRTYKPELFTSEDASAVPLRARWTWLGLWAQCDDHGRTKDNARLIKASVWPLDEVSLKDIDEDLAALAEQGLIVRYEVDGRRLIHVVNWHLHQKIQKPSKARFPMPPREFIEMDPNAEGFCRHCYGEAQAHLAASSGSPPVALPEDYGNTDVGLPLGKERKGKEGTRAGDTAVTVQEASSVDPTKCPSHQTTPHPPPCGACADARRAHAAKPTPTPGVPACPRHPDQPSGVKACPVCTREAAPAPNLRELMGGRAAG